MRCCCICYIDIFAKQKLKVELNRDHMLCKPITRLFLLIGLVLTGGCIHGMEEKPQEQRPNLNFLKIVHINEEIFELHQQWLTCIDESQKQQEKISKKRNEKIKSTKNVILKLNETIAQKTSKINSLNTSLDIYPMIGNYLATAACATIAVLGYTLTHRSHLGYLKSSMWLLLGIPSILFLFQAIKKTNILITIKADTRKLFKSIDSNKKELNLQRGSLIDQESKRPPEIDSGQYEIEKKIWRLYRTEFEKELLPLFQIASTKKDLDRDILSPDDSFLLAVIANYGQNNKNKNAPFKQFYVDAAEAMIDGYSYGGRYCQLIYSFIHDKKFPSEPSKSPSNYYKLEQIIKDNDPEVQKALVQYNELKNKPLEPE
jgi:hypothetical protein